MGFGGRGAFGAAGCVWAGTAHGRTVPRGAGDARAAGREVLKSDAIFFLSTIFARSSMVSDALSQLNVICIFEIKLFRYFCNGVLHHVLGINLIVGGFCMANVKRFMLTLLLGALVWMVPSAAQAAPNLLVETVRVRIKDAKPGGDYVVNTMDAFGNRKPVTYVIECFPVGSDRSVSWLRVDKTSLVDKTNRNEILTYKDFPEPNFQTHDDLKRIENGWELTLWTIPGKEGTAATELKVWSTKDGHGGTEKEVATKTLRVTTKDVPVHGIKLKVEAQEPVPVGKGGTLRVEYTPKDATDKRVKITSDDGVVEVLPTNVPGVFSFKVLKNGSAHLHAVAEDGRVGAPTAEETFTVVQHHISDVKMAMSDGEQGGAGYDRLICRNQTKDWMLHVTVTSDGPIVGLEKELAWEGKIGTRPIADGLGAPIYGKGAPHNGNKVWPPALVGRSSQKQPDGTVKTQLEYAFKADEKVDAPYLNLTLSWTDGNGATKTASYTLKIGEVKVNSFGVDPKETDLYVGSKPNGFITVTPAPSLAYNQGFSVRRKPGTGSDRVLKAEPIESPTGSGRYVFEAKEAGTATLTIAAADGEYTQDVTVNVRKVGVKTFALRNETESKNITGGDYVLRLKKGERVQLRLDVTSEQAYDRGFDIVGASTAGNSRTLTVGDAGTLTIEALEGAWGQPGLYEVTGAVPGNAPAAFTLKSNADREGGAAGEKLTFSFKYVVEPNPVRGITLDRQSLEFVYDAEAPKSIRGGVDAQAVRIDVTPETAADATFKFTVIPGWLEVQDANGKKVIAKTKSYPAGDYYVKVTDPRNAGKNLQTQTAEIKVVSDSQSGVTATLRVVLKYIPVDHFEVEGKTELTVDRAERFTVRVVPADASNPRFKLVVKSNKRSNVPLGVVAVSQGGEQINVVNFGNTEKKKEGVPGEITVVGNEVSQPGEQFTLALKAVERGSVGSEYVSAGFTVGIVPVQSVSYAPELVVPIRSSAFKHPYTVLPVTVTPANASRPALEFKRNIGNNTGNPIQVSVTGPQGEGVYLFEPLNKNNYTDRAEELVGVVKDSKTKGGALKVKVENVKPTKITVVDLEGNEITKPIELAKGVSYSYPLRVLVEPDDVSLAALEWKRISGNAAPGWVQQVNAERDTANLRLILNYLVQTKDFAIGTKSGFEISHRFGDGSAATKKQVFFDQPRNDIEQITVEPAEVVFAGESATAIVTVTYSPEVVDNDVLGHSMVRIVPKGLLPTIVVTQIEKLGNVYKYEIKYNASVYAETTEVTFKATVGGASGKCTVVALPSGAATDFTLSSADPKMKDGVLDLILGEEGKDVAAANLFRAPSTQDAFYRVVGWELWRGGTKLELSKYLEVERKAFKNGVGFGSTWELQLRGLNKTAEGLDDAPLTLRAVMGTGVNRRTSDIRVRVRRSAKANERPIESVEFPIERLVVGLGETRTVEMEVAPADPSLKRLQWDFYSVPGKIHAPVSVVEGSGDEWKSLKITAGSIVGFTRMRVRASDMYGRQTSRMLLIEVVQSHYPIVVDVVDGEGRPLADARVQIRENGNNQPWLFSAYTGDEGRVEYDAVSKKTYVAEVSRSGYVRNRNNPATIYVGNKLVQVRWVLDRDLTKPVLYGVRFEVKGDGKALPGAVVSFAGFGDAESDAQGVAVYRDVPAGSYYATVRAEGYRPATVAVEHGMLEATTVQVSLEKEPMVTQKHSLTVVVRNKETQGLVEDAVVTVDGRAGVTTDVNGVATVANLEDGEYAVTVEGSGEPWKEENGKKYYYKPQTVQVKVAGVNTRLEVALESVVANEQPKPTMRTLMVVTVDGEYGVMLDGVAVRVAGGDIQETANGEARFQLADSRSKRKVTASKRGYVSQEEQVLVNGADATVRFTMAVQTYSVALTVKGVGGTVLKDAVVYLDGSRKATTDATGIARFDNVRVGGHTLLAVADEYVNGVLGVDVSSNFAGEITLKRGFSPKPREYTLTVTVKSGSNPLPGATVRLESGKTAETDANGMATFAVLNGPYVVEAFKTGYKRGVGTVEVKDNDANLNIAMEEDFSPYVQSSVTITVVDVVTGQALDNAKVVITGATPAKHSGNEWEYKLGKGTYTLVVSCEGYVTQVEDLEVRNANITKNIKLGRGKNPKFDLTVKVVTYGGQPLDGAEVTIEGQRAKGTQANVTTFSLVPGAYSVKVSKAGYGSQTVEVVVKDKAVEQQVTLLRRFRVTFDAKGGRFTDGTKTQEEMVEEGKQVEEPAEPSRNNFDFKGWTLGGAVYDFAEPVTKDIVLEAKWGKKAGVTYYTVTLKANGGKFANGSDSTTVEVEGGAVMDEGAVEKPVKDGYKLMGWTLEGEVYDFTAPVNGNIKLVANWKELSGMMHTVIFLAYGGTPEPEEQEVQHGGTATKPVDPAKSGFRFVRWNWKGNPYSFDAKVVDDLVLEAEYEANPGVTVRKVTFLANGGLFGNGQARMEVEVENNTKVSRPTHSAPTRKDHKLVNWTLNGAPYDFETLVTADIELVAQWKVNSGKKQHEVVFMAYGGKPEPETQTVVDGAQVNRPKDPEKNGYRFAGWNSNGSRYDFNAQVKKDLVLEAQWEANPGVTEVKVVFLANGGLFANGEKRIEVGVARGETVNPPTQGISRAGFTLEGWTLKGETYDFTKPVTEDIELAALWKPETGITVYRVVFMAQGGRPEPPMQLVKSGEKVQQPADPAKEGFSFQGWTKNGAVYNFEDPVMADIVLEAQWQDNTPATKKYTVVFVANGGTFADGKNRMEFKVAEGSRVEEPAKPSRGVDFTFSGWMFRGAAYDFTRPVKEDLVLEAQWNANSGIEIFTVTFMANGGAPEPLVQIVKKGEKAQEPKDVKKEDFTLTGWTKDGSTLYNFDNPVTADIVLKAMWNKNSGVTTHTVTYVANGGKFADESNQLTIEVADGKPANRPTDPVYEGFTFIGWTLNGAPYTFAEQVTADIVLVAQWKANQGVKAYRVVFMALGGTPEPPVQLVAEGKPAQRPADPAKDGFTFQEWTLNGAAYSFTDAVTKDIVLRAKWQANSGVKERTVTFMALGGAFADGSDVQKFKVKDGGTVLEPTAPVKEGYTLTGWTKDGSVKYNFADAVNADLVLYAMWEKKDPSVKEHTVVFVANGGTFADGKNRMEFTVADGALLTQPEKPTRTDFTFGGWMLRGAEYDFTRPVKEDLVLEARWTPKPGIETFTVTFMANGGTPEPLVQLVKNGEKAQEPKDVKKEGYTLKGWTKDGSAKYDFTVTSVNENIVLYAMWEKKPTVTVEHTVVFMANGGTFADGKNRMEFKVADRTLANRPTDPVKVGYAFMGWKLNGEEYDFTEPVTSNIELMAQWEKNASLWCTVHFMTLGGEPQPEVQKLQKGEKAQQPTTSPAKEGFTFQGWTLNGVAYNFSDTVKESIVLKAKWQVNPGVTERTVTFMALGGAFADGSDVMVFTVQDGKRVPRPKDDPIKEGFTLQGWTLNGEAYDFTTAVTKDIVLKAQWVKKDPSVTEHTVTFMALGGKFADGTDVQSFTVKDGEAVLKPTAPVKKGFTFQEWMLEGVPYNFTTAVTKDIVLKAQWVKKDPSVKEHMVTFMALGGAFADGSDVQSFTVKDGEAVLEPMAPEKEGYTLQGWTLNGETYDFSKAVTKDIVLKAQWEKRDPSMTEHKVTFMALGGAFADGSDVQSFTVKDGEMVLKPTAPVKEGYTLEGWTKDGNGEYDFDTSVREDIVLYAMWKKDAGVMVEHTVVFVANGGTFADGKEQMEFKVADGKAVLKPTAPVKAGVFFSGWIRQGGEKYDFSQPVKEDLVLEARWESSEHTVSFMALGGRPEPQAQRVVHGDKATRPQVNPSKEGFTFQGWTKNGNALYNFDDEVTESIALKAMWEKSDPSVTVRTVTFMALGGKFADGSDVQTFTVKDREAVLEPTAPVKAGFILAGWTLDGAAYDFTSVVTKDIVLKAQWEKENPGVAERTVTFMALGGAFADGSDVQTFTVKAGETVLEPTAPVKEGYTLKGWTKDRSAKYDFTVAVTEDIVLYAMWEKNAGVTKEHTVTFMALGGAFADGSDVQSFTVKDGATVRKPQDPAKKGFTFQGWTLDGAPYGFTEAVTKDIVLKAKWEKVDPNMTEYTVTFMALGGAFADGSDVQSFTVKAGETVLEPTAPVKEGYTLKGWKKADGAGYNFGDRVNADLVLYAVWEKNAGVTVEHKVVFVATGGTFADGKNRMKFKVADGAVLTQPEKPTRADFTFRRWMLRGTAYDFAQPVKEDLVLEAQWIANPGVETFTVTFMANGGAPEPLAQIVKKDGTAQKPIDVKKEGFKLKGWTKDGSTLYNFDDAVTADLVLKAQWEKEDPSMATHVVTYVANGGKFADGSERMEVEVAAGTLANRPTDPVKKGSALTGWKLGSAKYDFTEPVTEDIELEAQWESSEHTVSFMTLGGAPEPQEQRVEHGGTAARPQDEPRKVGFTFRGWMLDGAEYVFEEAVTKDIALKAKWEKEPGVTERMVTFMALGGAFADGSDVLSFTVKDSATVRKPKDPVKAGFILAGWTLDGAPYDFNKTVTKDIVLKAQWEKENPGITEYKVTFMALGGAFADGSDVQTFTVKAGETVLEPTAPVKEGYTLKGWSEDGSAEYRFKTPVVADLVLYAMWEKKQTVTKEHLVVFVANGGAFADRKNRMAFMVADGAVLLEPAKPTREDFTFSGWMLRGAAYDFTRPVSEDLVLEAQWVPNPDIETFTVTFMAYGGTPEPLAQIVKKGEKAQEPIDVKKERFTLKGWTLGGDAYDFTTAVIADIVLKAQWEANAGVTVHKVTYVANGGKFADGSDRMEVEVADETLANRPTDPEKDGCALTRWTLDGAEYDFTQKVTSDIELVAQWEEQFFKVVFIANGGSPEPAIQRVKKGEKAQKPSAEEEPKMAGYVFKGWMLGEERYDFTKEVTKDIVLLAKWAEETTLVESRLLANVRVYPNPVARVLSVQAEAEVVRYELTNASGVRVKMGAPSASDLRLDVSQLPEGLYLLRLADAEGNWTICKVLVQR